MTSNKFAAIGILAVLLMSLGMVSAASLAITEIVIPNSVDQDAGSFEITFNLSNTAYQNADVAQA